MPLFKSAHDALRFAYNFNGTNVVKATLGIPPAPTGRGLGGLEGAGEAGNVKRVAEGISKQITNWVWATYLPSRIPCRCPNWCCQGWKFRKEWIFSVMEMTVIVFGEDSVPDRKEWEEKDILERGKQLIVAQVFLPKEYRLKIEAIVEKLNKKKIKIKERQAYYLLKTVVTFFRGTRKQRGVGQVFMEAIDKELRKAGIVGDAE